MTKLNLILGLLVLLIVCNGFLFYRLSQHPKPPHRNDGPREFIAATLQFNDSQMKAYDVLIQDHRFNIQQTDDSIRQLKETLFSQFTQTDPIRRDSFLTAINSLQMKIEMIHWEHLKQIEALCLPEQQKNWLELEKHMAALFVKPPHPPRP